MSLEPVFTVTEDARGKLVRCQIGEHVGAARVMSTGEQEARQRAEARAREMAAGANR